MVRKYSYKSPHKQSLQKFASAKAAAASKHVARTITAISWSANGRILYFGRGDGALCAVDPEDGALLGKTRISSGVSSIRVHPQHPGVLICTQALGRPVLVVFDSTSRRRSKPNRAVLGPGAPNMTATVGSPGCLIQPPVLCVVRAWTRELTLDDIPASRRVPADAGRSPTNGAAACWLYRSRSKTRSSQMQHGSNDWSLLLATTDSHLVEIDVTLRVPAPVQSSTADSMADTHELSSASPPTEVKPLSTHASPVRLRILGVSPTATAVSHPFLRELPGRGLGEWEAAGSSNGAQLILCTRSGVHMLHHDAQYHEVHAEQGDVAESDRKMSAGPDAVLGTGTGTGTDLGGGLGMGTTQSSEKVSLSSSASEPPRAATLGENHSEEGRAPSLLVARESYVDPVDNTALAQAAVSTDGRWVIALPDPRDRGVKSGQLFLFQRGLIGGIDSMRLPAYSGDAACIEVNPSRNELVIIADTGMLWMLVPRRIDTFAGPMFPSGFDVVGRNEAYEEGEDEQDAVLEDGTVVMDRVLDRVHRIQQAHAVMLGGNLGVQVSGKNNFGKPRSEEAMRAAGAAAGVVDDSAEDATLLRSLGISAGTKVQVLDHDIKGSGIMRLKSIAGGKRPRDLDVHLPEEGSPSKLAREDKVALTDGPGVVRDWQQQARNLHLEEVTRSVTETNDPVDILTIPVGRFEGFPLVASAGASRSIESLASLPPLQALSARLPPRDPAVAQLPALIGLASADGSKADPQAVVIESTGAGGNPGPDDVVVPLLSSPPPAISPADASTPMALEEQAAANVPARPSEKPVAGPAQASSEARAPIEISGSSHQGTAIHAWDGASREDQEWFVSRCVDAGKLAALQRMAERPMG